MHLRPAALALAACSSFLLNPDGVKPPGSGFMGPDSAADRARQDRNPAATIGAVGQDPDADKVGQVRNPEPRPEPPEEDPKRLPLRRIGRLGTRRLQQLRGVYSVAFSHDSETLLVGSDKRAPSLWDAATGRELGELEQISMNPEVYCLTFSPDGQRILGLLWPWDMWAIWETATGKSLRRELEGYHWSHVRPAFSADGKSLALVKQEQSRGSTIVLLEARTGREIRRFTSETSVDELAFSAGGKTLVALTPAFRNDEEGPPRVAGAVTVWDVATGKRLSRDERVEPSALSPDGRLYTHRAAGRRIEVREVGGPEPVCTLDMPDGSRVFSPDGKLLACVDEHNTVSIRDIPSGRVVRQIAGRKSPETNPQWSYRLFRFSPDGKVLAGGVNGNRLIDDVLAPLFLWDVGSGEELLARDDHFGPVTCLTFSPDGRTVVSGSEDCTLRLWDRAGRHLRRFDGHRGAVEAVAFNPSGCTLASAGGDRTLRLWDVASGRELRSRDAPETGVAALHFSADGKDLLCWDQKGIVHVYDTTSDPWAVRTERTILPKDALHSLGWFPPGKEAREEESIALTHVVTAADSRLAATVHQIPSSEFQERHCRLRVWETATGALIADLGEGDETTAVAFGPGGRCLFTAHVEPSGWGTGIRVWDLTTGKELGFLTLYPAEILGLALSPDGTSLASGDRDAAILLWDATAVIPRPSQPSFGEEDLRHHWSRLHGTDAREAFQSAQRLAGSPGQAVPFLSERLRSLIPSRLSRVPRLIEDLDDDTFAVREAASRELESLGDWAEPAVRRAAHKPASLEAARRLRDLGRTIGDSPSPDRLALLRGMSVLEHIGTAPARATLAELAKAAPDTWLVAEVEASLRRLAQGQKQP